MTPLDLVACYGRTAIRAWSRRTLRSACRQLIWCHARGMSGVAPTEGSEVRTSVVSVVICSYLLNRLVKRSRAERPEGSLPTFVEGHIRFLGNPYPPRYRAAFAFSLILYRPCHQALLRDPFLHSGACSVYHVPYVYHAWVRPRLSAGDLSRLRPENWQPLNRPHTFWSSLSAS